MFKIKFVISSGNLCDAQSKLATFIVSNLRSEIILILDKENIVVQGIILYFA